MSLRRPRIKSAVNLAALANGRRKQAEPAPPINEEISTENSTENDTLDKNITSELVEPATSNTLKDVTSNCKVEENSSPSNEKAEISEKSTANSNNDNVVLEKSSSCDNGRDHVIEGPNLDHLKPIENPFSPPPPVRPAVGALRFKSKFKPNLNENRGRIRRFSGSLSDLGSPPPVGSPYKKIRTISCSSSTGNESDADHPNPDDVLMKKPPPIQRLVVLNEMTSPCPSPRSGPCPSPRSGPCPSPRSGPCPSPRSGPCPSPRSVYSVDMDSIKSPQHMTCPSPRQRHVTGNRDSMEGLENRDPTVLELRKADYKKKFTTGVPERTNITMFDLIYYNPSAGNRMSNSNSRSSSRAGSRLNSRASSVDPQNEDECRLEAVRQRLEEEAVDDVEPVVEQNGKDTHTPDESLDAEEEDAMPVPQVKVAPDGSIIIDETSTLIQTTAAKKAKEDLLKTPLIYESNDKATNYGSWVKRKKTVDWSDKETVRFFKALSILGTDFSLMENLFKKRTRQELKMKYKKEEKINKALIDRCLTKGLQFDLSIMDSEEDEAEVEITKKPKPRRKSTAEPKQKKPRKGKNKRSYYGSSGDEQTEVEPKKQKRGKKKDKINDVLNQGIGIASPGGVSIQSPRSVHTYVSPARVYTPPVIPTYSPILNPNVIDNSNVSSTGDVNSNPRAESQNGSLLKTLLSRNAQLPTVQSTGFAFPPALLAANPSLANAAPGSLVVVASPSNSSTNPNHQLLQVFVVGETQPEVINESNDVTNDPDNLIVEETYLRVYQEGDGEVVVQQPDSIETMEIIRSET